MLLFSTLHVITSIYLDTLRDEIDLCAAGRKWEVESVVQPEELRHTVPPVTSYNYISHMRYGIQVRSHLAIQ
jgi:hypothetical protein